MLSIVSMNRAGLKDGCLSVKVDFEFDNASTLPERVVTVSGMSYIIAKDSTAKNTVTNVNYKYNGSKWVKVTETVEPVTGGTITDNGDYTITSNEYTGLSDISVDVSGGGPSPTPETFEVEFIINSETGVLSATKTYAQTLAAIQNNNIINFTLDAPFSCIYGGCFIFSNPVTEKDDMYFFLSPDSPTFRDEDGSILHFEGIIWTETDITIKGYDYSQN